MPNVTHVDSDELLCLYLHFSSRKKHKIFLNLDFDFKLEKFLSLFKIVLALVVFFSIYFV